MRRSSISTWCLEPLAQGGFARLFTAHAKARSDAPHAVFKLPFRAGERTSRFAYRFRCECEIVQRLDHPLLPRYIDSGDGGQGFPAYLCYALVPGQTLRQHLEGMTAEPTARHVLARRVYLGLCGVLRYLHDAGVAVAHGDICPRNLIVDGASVHLIDFGTAKVIDGDPSPHDLYGVAQPYYISPDQARGAWNASSDIYQLGLVLYEILTGRRYNPGADFRSCRVHAAAADDYVPERAVSDRFWSRLLAGLLTAEPARRLQAVDLPPLP